MNHICTWLCADEKGEESLFPQTGMVSSSKDHQDIYWRCLILFFITSRRFNKNEKHILFTNISSLPIVDGRRVAGIMDALNVQVIHTSFNYKTPKGYYGAFQNQFYEFSILENIALSELGKSDDDQFLIVDSDCIFLRPAAPMFHTAHSNGGFMSVLNHLAPDQICNGLSCNDLKEIYSELLGAPVNEVPPYHLGEFLLCSKKIIDKLYADFRQLWPVLLERHEDGKKKFNEEAHTLSYLYHRQQLQPDFESKFMKRIWTNPVFSRNVKENDPAMTIWHLPSEKSIGLKRLYEFFTNQHQYGFALTDEEYTEIIQRKLGIPHLSIPMLIQYYTFSYSKAIGKRLPWKKRA